MVTMFEEEQSACGIRTMGKSRSFARDPTLSVDRDPDAARVHDETTSMERFGIGSARLEQATCASRG